jgi:hypothetical protein
MCQDDALSAMPQKLNHGPTALRAAPASSKFVAYFHLIGTTAMTISARLHGRRQNHVRQRTLCSP